MAFDVKQYIEQLAQTAGLSDDEKAGILKVAANEKFAKSLSDDVLRQQDYSRNMDQLKAEQTKTTGYYQQLLNWKAEQEALIAQQLNGQQQQQQQVTGEYLTKKELEAFQTKYKAELEQQGQTFVNLLEVGMNLATQHVNEFHEPLDTGALRKIAVEKNLSLKQAYDEYVAPRRTELQSQSFAAKLAAAKEEGAREFASKHKIPVDTQPREYHVMLDRDPKKQVGADDYVPNSGMKTPAMDRQLRANFVEEWDKSGAGTSTQ